MGLLHGVAPDPRIKALYGEQAYAHAQKAQIHYIATREGIHPTNDLTNAILAVSGAGDVAALLKGVGQVGAKELAGAGAEAAAKTTASTAESTTLKRLLGAGFAKRTARQGIVRPAVKRAAAKAEPAAVATARKGLARRVGQFAGRAPKPVRVGAAITGRVASAPIRHPFTAPIAAQTPMALLHGDPTLYGKAFTGSGVLASVGDTIGNVVAPAVPSKVAQNIVHEAFSLPSAALPSVYLPLAGAVEASHGDTSRLTKLLAGYKKTGLLPAVFRGDAGAALKSIQNHPLYAALEVGGAAAVVGRGAGAVVRGATGGRVAGTARPPVYIRGQEHLGNVNELMGRGRYSPDLLRQLAQRVHDKRRGPYVEPHRFRNPVNKALVHTARRFVFGEEQLRRVNRHERMKLMHDARPKSSRFKTDNASANVVAQAVQRVAQKPETFATDLRKYRAGLEAEHNSGQLTPPEQASNRAMLAQVDKAIHSGNPEEVAKAANVFLEHHGKIVDGLVQRGLLNRDQAIKSAAFPWARVHMGAGYKDGVGLVDAHGNPLSGEAVAASMKRRGVEPPGFLSQKPKSPGAKAYFQGFFPERQSLHGQPRTGKATVAGTYDASYKALTEQLLFSGSKLDAAKSFDKMIHQFGSHVPPTAKTLQDAWDALSNPHRFGWEGPGPHVKLRPIRIAPFRAAAEEIAKAQEHQGLDNPLLDPAQSAKSENLTGQLLAMSAKEGPGPYAYISDVVYKELYGHFKGSGTAEKVSQQAGQLFKGAVLPFSPSFYVGNAVDNWIRMALAGIGPTDIRLGRQIIHGRGDFPGLKAQDPAAAESIVPGAGYSSVGRLSVHRGSHQYEGTALQGTARAIEALGKTHGTKELYALYTHSRDLLMGINSTFFERLPQYGAVGKEARRELQATTGHWHKALLVSDGAFQDLLNGLRNTPKQIQYARAVEEVFANWGKNSPFARHVLSSFMPFWMWARAASRFVLLTMPAHHPVATGLIAAAADMTEQERAKLGLDKFVGSAPAPGFLQGGLPINGGIAPWSKYTSFGVFSDLPSFVGRLFFPQAQSALQNLGGTDWKGEKLVDKNGYPAGEQQRVVTAGLSVFESFVPAFNLGQSVLSGNAGRLLPTYAYKGSKLDYLRSLSRSKTFTSGPSSGGGSGAIDYGAVATGGASSSGVDYGAVATGGR